MVETGRWRPLSSCEILAARYLGAPSHFERRADFTFRRNALGSVVVLGARKRSGLCAAVAQMVRAPVCGTGGRWFEPTQLYHFPIATCFPLPFWPLRIQRAECLASGIDRRHFFLTCAAVRHWRDRGNTRTRGHDPAGLASRIENDYACRG